MIGIDVGGANLKIVDGGGVHIQYCPLYEGAPIEEILGQHVGEDAAVVMSGELADCFRTKMEGVKSIVRAVRSIFPRAIFYGTDGSFHDEPVPQLAAANWLVSADFLKDLYPDSLLCDIGSTTTDIIPLSRFDDLKGLRDLDRLKRGYLIYHGLLRTGVPTLLRSVRIDGTRVPVATEYFASAADVHLVLGHISPARYSCPAPDGGERNYEAALRRLARVVCADLEEIGEDGAKAIARAFWRAQKDEVVQAVRRIADESGCRQIVVAGIGSGLWSRVLDGIDLCEEMGSYADALPAYAVREVAQRTAGL
ncbi:MAG: hydantoinase/oxoprolinase family protein [Methanoculleaceae archaeon]